MVRCVPRAKVAPPRVQLDGTGCVSSLSNGNSRASSVVVALPRLKRGATKSLRPVSSWQIRAGTEAQCPVMRSTVVHAGHSAALVKATSRATVATSGQDRPASRSAMACRLTPEPSAAARRLSPRSPRTPARARAMCRTASVAGSALGCSGQASGSSVSCRPGGEVRGRVRRSCAHHPVHQSRSAVEWLLVQPICMDRGP